MPQLPLGDIGAGVVIWDPDGTPVNLGAVLGKINMTHNDDWAPVEEETSGSMPVDGVFSGGACELTVPLTRSEWSKLAAVLPGATLNTSELTFKNKCGSDMYVLAKPIYIKPVKDLVVGTTKASWVKLYKCYPIREFEIGWDRNSQRVLGVKFIVFPNQDSGYEGNLYTLGVNT